MRDHKRISKVLDRLKKLWEVNPDMRLTQLIGNVFPCTEMTRIDPYYIEDEEFISTLEEFYSKKRTFRVGGQQDLKKLLDEV